MWRKQMKGLRPRQVIKRGNVGPLDLIRGQVLSFQHLVNEGVEGGKRKVAEE